MFNIVGDAPIGDILQAPIKWSDVQVALIAATPGAVRNAGSISVRFLPGRGPAELRNFEVAVVMPAGRAAAAGVTARLRALMTTLRGAPAAPPKPFVEWLLDLRRAITERMRPLEIVFEWNAKRIRVAEAERHHAPRGD